MKMHKYLPKYQEQHTYYVYEVWSKMEALRKSIGNISELPFVLLTFLRVPNRFACFCVLFCKPEKTHHHRSWIMPPSLLTWTQMLNGPHTFLHAKTKTVYAKIWSNWYGNGSITHMEKQIKTCFSACPWCTTLAWVHKLMSPMFCSNFAWPTFGVNVLAGDTPPWGDGTKYWETWEKGLMFIRSKPKEL